MPSSLYSSEQSPQLSELYTVVGNVVERIPAMHTGEILTVPWACTSLMMSVWKHMLAIYMPSLKKKSNQVSWLIQLLNCLIFLLIGDINFFLLYHMSFQTYDFNTFTTMCIVFSCVHYLIFSEETFLFDMTFVYFYICYLWLVCH